MEINSNSVSLSAAIHQVWDEWSKPTRSRLIAFALTVLALTIAFPVLAADDSPLTDITKFRGNVIIHGKDNPLCHLLLKGQDGWRNAFSFPQWQLAENVKSRGGSHVYWAAVDIENNGRPRVGLSIHGYIGPWDIQGLDIYDLGLREFLEGKWTQDALDSSKLLLTSRGVLNHRDMGFRQPTAHVPAGYERSVEAPVVVPFVYGGTQYLLLYRSDRVNEYFRQERAGKAKGLAIPLSPIVVVYGSGMVATDVCYLGKK